MSITRSSLVGRNKFDCLELGQLLGLNLLLEYFLIQNGDPASGLVGLQVCPGIVCAHKAADFLKPFTDFVSGNPVESVAQNGTGLVLPKEIQRYSSFRIYDMQKGSQPLGEEICHRYKRVVDLVAKTLPRKILNPWQKCREGNLHPWQNQ